MVNYLRRTSTSAQAHSNLQKTERNWVLYTTWGAETRPEKHLDFVYLCIYTK